MIWSKKCLVGPRMAPDVVNPRMLELEVTKEMLNELFDLRTHEDQAVEERMLLRLRASPLPFQGYAFMFIRIAMLRHSEPSRGSCPNCTQRLWNNGLVRRTFRPVLPVA